MLFIIFEIVYIVWKVLLIFPVARPAVNLTSQQLLTAFMKALVSAKSFQKLRKIDISSSNVTGRILFLRFIILNRTSNCSALGAEPLKMNHEARSKK